MCFKDAVDLAANIVTIAGFFGLFIGFITWLNSQKSLHQAVITSCSDRYQKLAANLISAANPDATACSYVELCNEELFYIANNYLPEAVAFEWLEGMLACISLRHGSGYISYSSAEEATPSPLTKAIWNLLDRQNYPRVRAAFTLAEAEKSQLETTDNAASRQTIMLKLVLAKVQQHEANTPYAPLLSRGWRKWWQAMMR